MRKIIYIITSAFSRGRHVPEWGMSPGVYGLGDRIGFQVIGITATSRPGCVYQGWIFPTEKQAKEEAKRLRRGIHRRRTRRYKCDSTPL